VSGHDQLSRSAGAPKRINTLTQQRMLCAMLHRKRVASAAPAAMALLRHNDARPCAFLTISNPSCSCRAGRARPSRRQSSSQLTGRPSELPALMQLAGPPA
jgi:hypothetical protein